MRGVFAGALKRLGWNRKGSVASLRGSDAQLTISFQRSQYDSVFFVNLGIWLLALGDAVEFPKHSQCHLQFRLERLFPELSSLLKPEDVDLAALEEQLLRHGADLQRLTDLNYLRELYASGGLSDGLIRKEAREILT